MNPTTLTHADASTLQALRAVLVQADKIAAHCECKTSDMVDVTALPVYGGETPDNTEEVYSWDITSLLVHDGEWRIVPR